MILWDKYIVEYGLISFQKFLVLCLLVIHNKITKEIERKSHTLRKHNQLIFSLNGMLELTLFMVQYGT